MCGIFGWVSLEAGVEARTRRSLYLHSLQRGKDSSGLVIGSEDKLDVVRSDEPVNLLMARTSIKRAVRKADYVFGHSRLVTNGNNDNQPVKYGNVLALHNGIILNADKLWKKTGLERHQKVDSEIIAALGNRWLESNGTLKGCGDLILDSVTGAASCVLVAPSVGEALVFSNFGSMFLLESSDSVLISSEKFPLTTLRKSHDSLSQVFSERLLKLPFSNSKLLETNQVSRDRKLVFDFVPDVGEAELLEDSDVAMRRCTKCILPDTMPFIEFDSNGECNYCLNYRKRNTPKDPSLLLELLHEYRQPKGAEVLMPFSGGRDSSYALHLLVREFGIRPITYTYDWGMVTDLGRRNISLMTSAMGVENIVVAADIEKKRRNIALNLKAWLKSPDLGLISLLTAGDKFFYKYVNLVRKQTGLSANLWGVNPLETTHFKAGFLGVPPELDSGQVFRSGVWGQVSYQSKRLNRMAQGSGYFNASLPDTWMGEYYRSVAPKKDYFHVFDYWRWDESEINESLVNDYGWELATDSHSTWRIGDGTAGFYNYVYKTVAGFSEHDTFRSNQIREGDLSRAEALRLAREDNRPRYDNIRWYLETIGFDFRTVIETVNRIPKLYD